MKELQKIAAILVLALLAGGLGSAQKRNKKYEPAELSANSSESIVIDSNGINPIKIDRAAGPFVLAVWDARGGAAEHFSVAVDKKGAPELYGLDTKTDNQHAAVLVDLDPGKYRLSLANTPDVSVPITLK
jgi:hypothetical protein